MTNTQQRTIDFAELEKYLMNLVQKSHEIYNEGLGVATDAKKQKLIDFIQSLKPIETFGGNNEQ